MKQEVQHQVTVYIKNEKRLPPVGFGIVLWEKLRYKAER